ncbi:MAG: hypothetical protein IPO67_01250 [Deltaproteobacteria bacterium]|nr:hypothetical protein [Deltaproteobacteria bacterium]
MRHLGLIALALTLVGCKDDAPSGDDSDAPPVDDTAPPEEECPPEEERTFYADGDGDGFGSPSSQVSACEAPPGHVEAAGDCDDGDGGVSPGGVEVCDARDNDCSGLVDDGVDNDGDGVDDCGDSCFFEALPADGEVVSYDGECAIDSTFDGAGWEGEVTRIGGTQFGVGVLVAQTNDDDGDGVITGADIPDLIVMNPNTYNSVIEELDLNGDGVYDPLEYTNGAALTVYSGDGSGELFSYYSSSSALGEFDSQDDSGVAVTLDADGAPLFFVVVTDKGGYNSYFTALEPDPDKAGGLRPRWVDLLGKNFFSAFAGNPAFGQRADGSALVGFGDRIYTLDGTLLASGTASASASSLVGSGATISSHVVFADLDGDGEDELITGGEVVSTSGATITLDKDYTHPAVGDLNGDGVPEIVAVKYRSSGIKVWDTKSWRSVSTSASGSVILAPPIVAELDGDAGLEIVVSGATTTVYNYVATGLTTSLSFSVAAQQLSAFDFDGDGVQTLLVGYALIDRGSLVGTLSTRTVTAITVDADGDGRVEFVTLQSEELSGFGAFGYSVNVVSPSKPFIADGSPVWPSYQRAESRLNLDGSLTTATDWWASSPARGGATFTRYEETPDLLPLVDACVSCLDEALLLGVNVQNVGAKRSEKGVPVAVYSDDGGTLTLLTTTTFERLSPGETAASQTLSLPLQPDGTDLVIIAGDAGDQTLTESECVETNNAVTVTVAGCAG